MVAPLNLYDTYKNATIHRALSLIQSQPWSCDCEDCKFARVHYVNLPFHDRVKLIALMIEMKESYEVKDGERITFMSDSEVSQRVERLMLRFEHKNMVLEKQATEKEEKKGGGGGGVKTRQTGGGKRVVKKSEPMAG